MSISGLALSRVTHQAFGALEATYVCAYVCGHAFLCDYYIIYIFFCSASLHHTHTWPPGGCRSVAG